MLYARPLHALLLAELPELQHELRQGEGVQGRALRLAEGEVEQRVRAVHLVADAAGGEGSDRGQLGAG